MSELPGDAFVMPTYERYPLTLVRGEGVHVWDDEGRVYLDFAGALGAMPLGHAHPAWLAAVHAQADRLALVSNLFATEPQAELAARLAALLPIDDARVFFSNSGAETNEAAIKLVRKWGLPQRRSKIIALEGSFHGRAVATLAATGQPPKRAAFEPLVDWFVHVPPGDIDAMRSVMGDDTAAVVLEPVMGESGVHPLDHRYLRSIRELTRERGALLVADEVQSGIGRCGEWLAISASGVVPDVVSLAKGLGGGLPIGATVASASIAFAAGDHGSTFGGGPIPCAAGLAVLKAIRDEGLLANARAQGNRIRGALAGLVGAGRVTDVRGAGLLIGVELGAPVAHHLVLAMIQEGVLATEAGPDVVRVSPPLVVTDRDVESAVGVLTAALARVANHKEVPV